MDGGHGRPVRSVSALGSRHTHHVPAGLLAHLAQRPQVLHRCWRALLSPGSGRLHHLPHYRHHTETISYRPEEPLPLLCVELPDPQMVLPLGLVLVQIPSGVCRYQHPQRFLVSTRFIDCDGLRGGLGSQPTGAAQRAFVTKRRKPRNG